MTTSSQTTAQSTKIRRFPPAGQTCWQSMRWATFSPVFSLQSPVSGCLCLSQCRDRWGHNRLVSISHIRVIIVKWDNDLVLRWHLFIFLNFAVLIFQETHNTRRKAQQKKRDKREERATKYIRSLGRCGTSRSGNDHQRAMKINSINLALLPMQWNKRSPIGPLRFHSNANRLLTICIRRAIDQRSGRLDKTRNTG